MDAPRTPPACSRRVPSGHRRGMTFLECVAAVGLLGIVAASIFGVFSFLQANQVRQQQLLGAHELASRLTLMYLDDPLGMPAAGSTLDYGPYSYRWEYREQPLTVIEAVPEGRDTARASTLPLDRFTEVIVRVWLSEKSGGSHVGVDATPQAQISRVFDPMFFFRNPDSAEHLLRNPARFQQFMERMMGFRNAGEQRGGNRNTPGSPRR